MDIRKVKKLIELMEESDIEEIEIKEGEEAVRISRARTSPTVSASPAAVTTEVVAPSAAPPAKAPEGTVVRAPMVGTFYRAPSPNSPPFVEEGQQVKVGDVLCIIESMKMMNQIKCEVAGRIEAILAENGKPVQFDQPMFTIV